MAAPSREQIAKLETRIQQLVDQDKKDDAGKLLFELIESCALGGDINNANRLRDWFYDVNPMALNEIIKLNEIIEEAMSGAVNDKFAIAWSGLREALNEEEFLALYHSLDEREVEANKVLVKAGSKLDAFFFITKGNVNVIAHCGEKNYAVKVLEPGTMIGENCFRSSYWTLSLVTLTPVTMSVLRLEQLNDLENRFPGFDGRLANYADRFENIPALLKENKLDRRVYKRTTVEYKIMFQAMGKDGKTDDRSFKGELDNISQGGLSFLIRIVNRDNRRMLFGRRLFISVQAEDGPFTFTGSVVAVTIQSFQDHDYAIHIAFDKPVAEEVIAPLLPKEEPEDEEIPDTDSGEDIAAESEEGGE